MTQPPSISVPAGYAPAFALGFADPNGALALVGGETPLPVTFDTGTPIQVQTMNSAPPPAPLAGSASASALVGPFAPVSGRAAVLTLSGTWEGTVRLERSTDSGATRHALTAGGLPWGNYTGNICEPVWFESEEGTELYLAITLASGTLGYRIAQ